MWNWSCEWKRGAEGDGLEANLSVRKIVLVSLVSER